MDIVTLFIFMYLLNQITWYEIFQGRIETEDESALHLLIHEHYRVLILDKMSYLLNLHFRYYYIGLAFNFGMSSLQIFLFVFFLLR